MQMILLDFLLLHERKTQAKLLVPHFGLFQAANQGRHRQ